MFKLKMSDAKLLKDMASAIAILVDEATFQINPENIKLRAMDPSRVAMVDFEWPKTVFEEYTCSEPAKMCINISELLKLIKRADRNEVVELSLFLMVFHFEITYGCLQSWRPIDQIVTSINQAFVI